jgi:hypothetical protein
VNVVTGDLGPAHGVLDVTGPPLLVLSTQLTEPERVPLARRELAEAGMQQPADPNAVTCLCGFPLDVNAASATAASQA